MNTANNITADGPMRSIRVDNLLINFTAEFQRVFDCNGSALKPCSFWRPTPAPDMLAGFFPLGDVFVPSHSNINESTVVAVVCEGTAANSDAGQDPALSKPVDFEPVWSDMQSMPRNGTVWLPVAPQGYVALGMVCSINHEKPSLNAVRCVREDLVIAATLGGRTWDDRGTGASKNFSIWDVHPPVAEAGEINFTPGTFFGCEGYSEPSTDVEVYSLRMPIPMQLNPGPALPALSGFEAPTPPEPSRPTQIAMLPWFAVEDHGRPAIDRFQESPYYYLQRTDRYVLIGYCHNNSDVSMLLKRKAPRILSRRDLRLFTRITSIQILEAWPAPESQAGRTIKFSANLSQSFTHTEISTKGWRAPESVVITSTVAKHKMMAVYQLQSNYDTWRENRTETGINFMYTDSNLLHWLEYPPENT